MNIYFPDLINYMQKIGEFFKFNLRLSFYYWYLISVWIKPYVRNPLNVFVFYFLVSKRNSELTINNPIYFSNFQINININNVTFFINFIFSSRKCWTIIKVSITVVSNTIRFIRKWLSNLQSGISYSNTHPLF